MEQQVNINLQAKDGRTPLHMTVRKQIFNIDKIIDNYPLKLNIYIEKYIVETEQLYF